MNLAGKCLSFLVGFYKFRLFCNQVKCCLKPPKKFPKTEYQFCYDALWQKAHSSRNSDSSVDFYASLSARHPFRYSIDRHTDLERLFNIDSVNGTITTLKALDREMSKWHNISVVATEISEFCFCFFYMFCFSNDFHADFFLILLKSVFISLKIYKQTALLVSTRCQEACD